MFRHCRMTVWFIALTVSCLCAREETIQRESLQAYVLRLQAPASESRAATTGSLWVDDGRLADLSTDYKAHRVGDPVTILVAESLQANNTGNVATDRSFKANSGIDAVGGLSFAEMQNLFSPHSSATLSGKAQATSSSSLRTSLAGRIAAVLNNGVLVIEAERQLTMNNERQTILVRGLVRPGDVGPDNNVISSAIGNLELEVKGKGIISEGTRPPNSVLRWLLRIVGF